MWDWVSLGVKLNKSRLCYDSERKRSNYVKCMDMNAWNYRWSESHSKVCQMCDIGEDETVELVILECEKYGSDRMKMMRVILTEMGREMNEVEGNGCCCC